MKWICGIAMLCCFVVLPVSGNARPTTDFCDSLSSYTTQFIANNPGGTSIKGFAYYLNGKFGYGTTQYAADYWLSRFDSCGVTFPSSVINCGAIESSMDSFYYKLPAYSVSSPSMLWSTYLNDYSYPVLDYSNEVQDWQLAMDWCGINYPAPDTLGSYCDSVKAIDSLFIVSAHLGDVYKLQYNLNKCFNFSGYFDSNMVWHPADLQYWYGQLTSCGIACPQSINCTRADSLMGLFTYRATNFASIAPSFLWTSILNNYNAAGSGATYTCSDWKTLLTCCGISYPSDDTLSSYCDSINAALAVADSVFPYMDGNEFSGFMDQQMGDWGYYDSTTWVFHNMQYWYNKVATCGAGCPKLLDCAQADSVLNVFYATYPDNQSHSASFLWTIELNRYTNARNGKWYSESDWRAMISCCGLSLPVTDTLYNYCDSLHAVLRAYRQKYPSGSDLFTYRNFLSNYLGWQHRDESTGAIVNNDDLYWYGKLQQCGDTMPRIVDCNFAANVLQQYYQSHPGDSIHVFPYSWSLALNITGAGADGNGNIWYYSPTSWESILDGCTVSYPIPDTLASRCDSIAYVINTMKSYGQKFSGLEWRMDDLFDYQHWDSLSNSYVSNSSAYWFSQIASCNECSLLIPCDTLHDLVDTFVTRYPQYYNHCPRQLLASYLNGKTDLTSDPEFWSAISSCCNVSLPTDTSMTVCDTAFDLTVQVSSIQQMMGDNCYPKWLLSAIFSENEYNWPIETLLAQDSLCGISPISICSDTLTTHCDSMRSIAYVYDLFFNVTHGEGGDMSPSPDDVYGALYGNSPDSPVLPMVMACDSNQCMAVNYTWSQTYPLFNSYSCVPKKAFVGVMNSVSGLSYSYEQWNTLFTHCGDTIPLVCDSIYSYCDSVLEAKDVADRIMSVFLIGDVEQASTMAFSAYYGRDMDYAEIDSIETYCETCGSFSRQASAMGDSVCQGDTALLYAFGGNSYMWNTGETSSEITTISGGAYSVTITGPDGCAATVLVQAQIYPTPVAVVSDDTICTNMNVGVLLAAGGDSYTWNTGEQGDIIESYDAGTYTVTVSDRHNCSATASGTITILAGPLVTTNNDTICIGSIATLNASGAQSYLWSTNETGNTITPGQSGEYTVTGTDAYGCQATAMATVFAGTKPQPPILTSESICSNNVHIFEIDSMYTDSANVVIEWSRKSDFSSSQIIDAINGNIQITINPDEEDTIWVQTVDTSTGCTSDPIYAIYAVHSIPSVSIGHDSTACSGSTLAVGGPDDDQTHIYVWSPWDVIDNPYSSEATAYIEDATTLTLFLYDSNGCAGVDSIHIGVYANPQANAGRDTIVFNSPATIHLGGNSSNSSLSYHWEPSTGLNDSTSGTSDALITSSTSFVLNVVDSNGCRSMDTAYIQVFIPLDSATIVTITDTVSGVSDTISTTPKTLTVSYKNIGIQTYNDSLLIDNDLPCLGCVKVTQLRIYVGNSAIPIFAIDDPVLPVVTPPVVDSFWNVIRIEEDLATATDSCFTDSLCPGQITLIWKKSQEKQNAAPVPLRLKSGSRSTDEIRVRFTAPAPVVPCQLNTITVAVAKSQDPAKVSHACNIIVKLDPALIANSSNISVTTGTTYSVVGSLTPGGTLTLSCPTIPVDFTTPAVVIAYTPNCAYLNSQLGTQTILQPKVTIEEVSTVPPIIHTPYSGTVVFDPFLSTATTTATTEVIPQDIQIPYITPVNTNPITCNVSVAPGSPNQYTLSYKNSGGAAFAGAIDIINALPATGITVANISVVNLSGGAPTPVSGSSGLVWDFSSSPLPAGAVCNVTVSLALDPNKCMSTPLSMTTTLRWGCGTPLTHNSTTTFCETTQPNTIQITSTDAPNVRISRILPATSIPWENTGCSHLQWQFLVENNGTGEANNLAIHLTNPTSAWTYIDPTAGVAVAGGSSNGNTTNIQAIITYLNAHPLAMSSTITTPASSASCSPHQRITDFEIALPPTLHFMPGEYLTLSFYTVRECPCVAPGSSVNFNDISLNSGYADNCGTAYVNNTVLAPTTINSMNNGTMVYPAYAGSSYISYERLGRSGADLGLQQVYNQTTTDINIPNGSSCTTTPTQFHILNYAFTSSTYGQYDLDPMLFCATGSLSSTTPPRLIGSNPEGQIIVDIMSDGYASGNISLSGAGLTMSHGAVTWASTSSPISNSNCNGFSGTRYVFDIQSLGFTTSDQFRDFFQGSTINFALNGCCSGSVPNPFIKITTYFKPSANICMTPGNCEIPIAEQDFQIFLHCPGCVIPGINVTASNLVRTSASLGFKDSDNDGLPDASGSGTAPQTPTAITATNYSTHQADINLSGSIVGDYLESYTSANVGAGVDGPTGFSLTTWRNYWEQHPWSTATTSGCVASVKPRLSDLIFQQDLVNADQVGITCTGGEVTWMRGASTSVTVPLVMTGPNTTLWPLTGVQHRNSFMLHLKDAAFGILSTDGFQESDRFEFHLTYKVCGTPATISQTEFIQGVNNVYLMASCNQNPTCTSGPDGITSANPTLNVTTTYPIVPDLIGHHQNPATPAGHLVISQIYVRPGAAGYNAAFVEVYNPTSSALTLPAFLLYATPGSSSWSSFGLSGSVSANGYYLIQVGSSGTGPSLSPNAIATIPNPLPTGGTFALSNAASPATTPMACLMQNASIVDLVGYGTATIYEGSPAAVPASIAQSMMRAQAGNQNTNNNQADFSPQTVAPRNAGTPVNAPHLLISQIYAGNSVYSNGFIELYNPTTTSVNLNGYSVQYSVNGTGTWALTALSGSIAANGYYLIREAASGSCTALPNFDATGSINLQMNSGTVVLVNNTTALTACPPQSAVIDKVGYGASSCRLGSLSAPALTTLKGIQRGNAGSLNTNQNNRDFAQAVPDARSTQSSTTACAYVSPNQNGLFFCQSCGSGHYVYPVTQTVKADWVDGGGCDKALNVSIESRINGGYDNVFPYEYRPVPAVQLVNGMVNVSGGPFITTINNVSSTNMTPSGVQTFAPNYSNTPNTRFMEATAPSAALVNNGTNLTQWIENVAGVPFVIPSSAYNGGTFPVNPGQVTPTTISFSGNRNGELVGDEYFKEVLSYNVRQLCPATSTPATISNNQVTISVSSDINATSCGLATARTINAVNNVNSLTTPYPRITTNPLNSPQYIYAGGATYLVCQIQFHINFASNINIPNFNIYTDINGAGIPQGLRLIAIADNSSFNSPITGIPVGTTSYTRYQLSNNINTNTVLNVWLKFRVESCCVLTCANQHEPGCSGTPQWEDVADHCLHLPMYYAWTCNGGNEIANSIPIPSSICFNAANDIVYVDGAIRPVLVQASKTLNPAQIIPCLNNQKFNLVIRSLETGGAGNMMLKVFLPPGLNIDANTASTGIHYIWGGHPAGTLTAIQNPLPGPFGLVEWDINLSSITAFNGPFVGINGFNNQQSPLFISYTVTPTCNFQLPAALPIDQDGNYYLPVSITGARYCDYNNSGALNLQYPQFYALKQFNGTLSPSCFGISAYSLSCQDVLTFTTSAPIGSATLTSLTSSTFVSPGFSVTGANTFGSNAPLAPGRYQLTVTSRGIGRPCTYSVTFYVFGPLQIDALHSTALCSGNSGGISVDIHGGQPNPNNVYTVAWTQVGNTAVHGSQSVRANNVAVPSNVLSVTANNASTPSVTISTINATACTGSNITFTATPVNGGSAPTYTWLVGTTVMVTGVSNTYSSSTLANGSVVTCKMTPNAPCNTTQVTSNAITVSVGNAITPGVSIAMIGGNNAICPGEPVSFKATAVSCGSTPTYQWYISGVAIPNTNSATFTTSAIVSGNNQVMCRVTPQSNSCNSTAVLSSIITVSLATAPVTPTVSISANAPLSGVCSNTPVTFTATAQYGGSAPTYRWSVNGTTVGTNSPTYTSTIPQNGANVSCTMISNSTCVAPSSTNAGTCSVSGISPGTYTVTVTDAAGCTATTTSTINVPRVVSMTLGATNGAQVTCTSDGRPVVSPIVIGGSQAYTYTWNSTATEPLFDPAPTATSQTASVPTIYTLTVTDMYGCSASASQTIGGSGDCCYGDNIVGGTGTYTYSGTQSSPLELSGGTLSALLATGTSATISLNGYMTVSSPMQINGCTNIILGDDAVIVVQTAGNLVSQTIGSLKITGSTLRACSRMWQGITVAPRCSLNISKSYIMDARTAVYAKNPGTHKIVIDGVMFYRDFTGISISGGSSDPLSVTNSAFEFGPITSGIYRNNYFAPNGYGISSSLPPASGIVISGNLNDVHINNSSTVGSNSFYGLHNGIFSISSNIYVENNHFQNILTPNVYSAQYNTWAGQYGLLDYPNGVAVYATSTPGVKIVPSLCFVDNCTFIDNNDAVKTDYITGANVFTYNKVPNTILAPTNSRNGFTVRSASNAFNIIENNYPMKNVCKGIVLNQNANSYNIVSYNQMMLAKITSTLSNTAGISISDFPGANSRYLDINTNSILNGQNGIAASNLTSIYGLSIENNIIHQWGMEPISDWQCGIRVTYSSNLGVLHNCITGNGSGTYPTQGNTSVYRQKAISFDRSQSCTIYNNFTQYTLYGHYYQANCQLSTERDLSGNENFQNYIGLATYPLGNSGNLGRNIGTSAFVRSNSFNHGVNSVPFLAELANFVYNTGGTVTTFYQKTGAYDNAILSNSKTYEINAQTGWPVSLTPYLSSYRHIPYDVSSPTVFVSQAYENCGTISFPNPDPGDLNEDRDMDMNIAKGQIEYAEFSDVARWNDQRDLYRRALSNTAVIDSSDTLKNFYANMMVSPIGKLETAKGKLRDAVVDRLGGYKTYLAGSVGAYNLSHPISFDGDSVASPENDTVYFKDLADSLVIVFASLSDSVSNIDSAYSIQKIGEMLDDISAITSSNEPEANEKRMYQIYGRLLTLGQDSLTSSDTTWVAALALACPMVEGDAVYLARAMAAAWQGGPTYIDDVELCHATGADKISRVKAEHLDSIDSEQFTFMPIPASQYLMLHYQALADFEVRLYTVTGQFINTTAMHADSNSKFIDIDALPTGIYFFDIRRGNTILRHGNLSIIK